MRDNANKRTDKQTKKILREKFGVLPKAKKIQFVTASLLTLFLVITVPVYAWFSLTSGVETLTKIKAPTTLDIKSGHAYSVQYLDLSNIDVTDIDTSKNGHKDYIFAVKAGSSTAAYDIQIAHTTNIPFTYTLYRASELGESDNAEFDAEKSDYVSTFTYYDEGEKKNIIYYYGYASNSAANETRVNTENDAILTLKSLNADTASASAYGRTIAENGDGNDGIYSNYTKYITSDQPEIYAVPLYSQHANITTWNPDHDYFILRISWNTGSDSSAFSEWNAAANNKETDMVYISAKASATQ